MPIEDKELKEALNSLKEWYEFSGELSEEDIVWKLYNFFTIAVDEDFKCVGQMLKIMDEAEEKN
jgi:hypothetical protein